MIWGHFLNSQWALVLCFTASVVVLHTRIRPLIVPISAIYFIVLSVLSSFWFTWHEGNHPAIQERLHAASAQATIALMVLIGFFSVITEAQAKAICLALGAFGQLVGLSVLCAALVYSSVQYKTPVFMNPSMTASFVAVTMPYALGLTRNHKWLRLAVLINTVVTVLVCKALAPVAVLGVVCAVIFWQRLWFWACAGACGLYAITQLNLGSSGRVEKWALALSGFLKFDVTDLLFGLGAGSTKVYLPLWDKTPDGSWTYLHNDWLQIGIEFGAIGLVLAVLCYAALIKTTIQKPFDLASTLGFGVLMALNPPLHWGLYAFCGAAIFRCGMTRG